jgi:hypothetical protein
MTTSEVKKLLEENNKTWEEFDEWMNGQTIGGTPENPDYYEYDVKRFIKGLKVDD